MIQKRPTFAPKPIGLSSESAALSRLCKHPLPFHVFVSVSLFYFIRKSKHVRNDILLDFYIFFVAISHSCILRRVA